MSEVEVVCPSGLTGMVRGWKTKEANILSNKKNIRNRTSLDKILANCWLSVTNPGPYECKDAKLEWQQVLLCDRFWALLCMRAATYGDAYEFSIQCSDRSLCGKKIEWECNLSELPFKELPKESRAKIAAGDNSFTAELTCGEYAGRAVNFHLPTGQHEKRSAEMMEGQDTRVVVAALATRIDSIEGVEKGHLVRVLDDMEMSDLMRLMDQFEAVDGGVDTTIEIECPHCGLLQDVDLPFGQGFFLPRRGRKSTGSGLLERL